MHALGRSSDSQSQVQTLFWGGLVPIADNGGHEDFVSPNDGARQSPAGNVGHPLDVGLLVPGVGQARVVFCDAIRVRSAKPGRMVLTLGLAFHWCGGLSSSKVLVEPPNCFLLRLVASLVVNAVMLDALDSHEFLDPGGALVSENGVILVVEQFLLFGDDKQHRTVLAND